MKLFNFPYVIRKEILYNMESSNIFLLSFVSEELREFIKTSQIRRYKNISHVEYNCCTTGEPFIYISYKGFMQLIMKIEEREETEQDYFPLNVSGKMIDFRMSNGFPAASYHPDERESVIKAIHNYFLDLFKNSVKYHWLASDYNHPIVQLQNLSLTCNLNLDRNFADMENLENFLSSAPVLKRVNMSVGTTTEPFSPDSKLYEAESIKVTQHSPTVPDILSRFQGRQAFLRWTNNGGDLELELWRFVNRWISGETFQNLEYLKVEIPKTIGPQFLNLISARRIDEEDQPPTHTLPKVSVKPTVTMTQIISISIEDIKKYVDFGFEPNTEPITSHAYVVRRTDGHVASVKVQGLLFCFGVWNKTEDEFLKMVRSPY
ncbi:hypothetical protein B9Z55_000631 [Caenorhabditis nigoni]|uniref:F-box domain-containing protein n=1 Tax=Caenorhabditis nigoni TaxID=1611254 RepID=A0A2G5VTZ0_9PELO|nr:hypothetical protein B9Z55_000631 [Caenorhabditis nigoni]